MTGRLGTVAGEDVLKGETPDGVVWPRRDLFDEERLCVPREDVDAVEQPGCDRGGGASVQLAGPGEQRQPRSLASRASSWAAAHRRNGGKTYRPATVRPSSGTSSPSPSGPPSSGDCQ